MKIGEGIIISMRLLTFIFIEKPFGIKVRALKYLILFRALKGILNNIKGSDKKLLQNETKIAILCSL
jgi:hypothetical protein